MKKVFSVAEKGRLVPLAKHRGLSILPMAIACQDFPSDRAFFWTLSLSLFTSGRAGVYYNLGKGQEKVKLRPEFASLLRKLLVIKGPLSIPLVLLSCQVISSYQQL